MIKKHASDKSTDEQGIDPLVNYVRISFKSFFSKQQHRMFSVKHVIDQNAFKKFAKYAETHFGWRLIAIDRVSTKAKGETKKRYSLFGAGEVIDEVIRERMIASGLSPFFMFTSAGRIGLVEKLHKYEPEPPPMFDPAAAEYEIYYTVQSDATGVDWSDVAAAASSQLTARLLNV